MIMLSKINVKLDKSLPSFLIGNIVTSIIKNTATPLQIALAVHLRDSKMQVRAFHDFGVTCLYDELLRFKKSVAFNANSKMGTVGLNNSNSGLLQGVGDNFDQQVCSQNGKIQTHSSMALLMTQSDYEGDDSKAEEVTPRISKSNMAQLIPYVIEVCRHTGPKKPIPHGSALTKQVPSLANLTETDMVLNHAREKDFEFLKSVHANQGCPEYNGFNTMKAREGLLLHKKTKNILSSTN